MGANYTVHKNIVRLSCPKCATPLECPLEDAGKADECPVCGEGFTVPGVEELNARRADEQRKADEAVRRKADVDRQAREAAERSRAAAKLQPVEYQGMLVPRDAPTTAVQPPEYPGLVSGASWLDAF